MGTAAGNRKAGARGREFERWFCSELSRWWTQDLTTPRDDIFWRTAGSGGRATSRGKLGKNTANANGDICALDPLGQPFLDLITVELKRGRNRISPGDLLDCMSKSAQQLWEEWIEQAVRSADIAGSFSWMVVTRRDRRRTLVTVPWHLRELLPGLNVRRAPEARFLVEVRTAVGPVCHDLLITTLDAFLSTHPSEFLELAKRA